MLKIKFKVNTEQAALQEKDTILVTETLDKNHANIFTLKLKDGTIDYRISTSGFRVKMPLNVSW